MRHYPGHAALAFLVCGSLFMFAAQKNYWESMPYTEWSDKEVDRLLKDSPWTKSVLLNTGPEEHRHPEARSGVRAARIR